jgi:hypothetical protein
MKKRPWREWFMALIKPQIVGLIFCDRIAFDAVKSEYSLIGLFQGRAFAKFPTSPMQMTVFGMLSGGRGEGTLDVSAYPLDGQIPHDPKTDWVYRQTKWTKFPDDPNMVVGIEFKVKNLVFPRPGEYLFVLSFEGDPIAERRMLIRKEKRRS